MNADNAVERFEFLDAIFRIAVTKVSEKRRRVERKRRGEEETGRRGKGRREEKRRREEEKRARKEGRTKQTLLLGYDGVCMCVCVCGVLCATVLVPSSFLS